jgi:cytochrome P450
MPLLGHSWALLARPLEFLCRLEPVADVVRVDLGTQSMALVTDPDLTATVLKDTKTFDKGGVFFDRVRHLTGESLLTVTYPGHRRQRRLLQPAFTPRRIEGYVAVMSREIEAVLSGWQPGATVDMRAEMYDVAARIAARTMFAAEVAGPAVVRIVDALAIYLESLFVEMWAPRFLQRLPWPGRDRYRAALETLHGAVDEIIASYRQTGVDHGDFLSMLLAGAQDGDPDALSPEEVHNQVITFFLAGIETTAAALTWTFYLLGRHGDVREAVTAEVRDVLGGRFPQGADLPKLAALRRTVFEALRLYPPTWIFTRVATTDVQLGSASIPAGMGVAYSPYLLQRSAANFDRPDEFRPDRWRSGESGVLRRNAFVPFGDGAHRCIGESFAMTEILLVLAAILERWDVRPGFEGVRVPVPRRATLTPGALPMQMLPLGGR